MNGALRTEEGTTSGIKENVPASVIEYECLRSPSNP